MEQDKRVHVHFQDCAWVDTKTSVQIANELKSDPAFAVDDPNRILLCDNLESHIAKDFINAMKPIGEVMFFPPM